MPAWADFHSEPEHSPRIPSRCVEGIIHRLFAQKDKDWPAQRAPALCIRE